MNIFIIFIFIFEFLLCFSQNDCIELVGFDDIPEDNKANGKGGNNKRERRKSKKEKEGKN